MPADSHAMKMIGVAGVALCAAAMLAAGCSGGRDIVPLETVANAAFKTESVGTARLSFEGTVTFNHDHAQRFKFTGHGIADWRTGSSKMTAAYKFRGPVQEVIKQQFGRPVSANPIVDGRKGIGKPSSRTPRRGVSLRPVHGAARRQTPKERNLGRLLGSGAAWTQPLSAATSYRAAAGRSAPGTDLLNPNVRG